MWHFLFINMWGWFNPTEAPHMFLHQELIFQKDTHIWWFDQKGNSLIVKWFSDLFGLLRGHANVQPRRTVNRKKIINLFFLMWQDMSCTGLMSVWSKIGRWLWKLKTLPKHDRNVCSHFVWTIQIIEKWSNVNSMFQNECNNFGVLGMTISAPPLV